MVCLNHALTHKSLKVLEEKILLDQLAQGDRDAFWQLWELHRDYLYHRCRVWMGGNYSEGEEALSLAMLKAWEKLPDYAAQITNVKAWLTRMTHNLCVDLHRKRQRSAIGIDKIEEITSTEQESLASSSYSPESNLLRSELEIMISQQINALSPRLREPFVLKFYKDMSYQAIAEQLRISRDNVYKRIQQARDFLKKQLQRYLSGLEKEKPLDPQKTAKSPVDNGSPQQMLTPNTNASTLTDSNGIQQINYQVTALCLEVLVSV